MLKSDEIKFLDENPIARMLHYRSTCIDKDRADQMFRFLKEAQIRHFPVTLSVECQGVVCSMTLCFDHDTSGWELYNYLAPWILSMAMKDATIRDQMAEIWPDLPGWYGRLLKDRGPQIAP